MSERPQTLSLPVLVGTCVAAAVGIAALVELKRAPLSPFAEVDALYLRWKEPLPPTACRKPAEIATLAAHGTELDALRKLEQPSPEASYLLARASLELGVPDPALDRALACEGFEAARHLAERQAKAH